MDTGESSEAKAKEKPEKERNEPGKEKAEPEEGKTQVNPRKKRAREEAKKRRMFKDNEKGREYFCELCSCNFYTVAQYNIHIQSYEHRKRKIAKGTGSSEGVAGGGGANTRRIVHCRVCNVYTNSAKQLAEHLGGARHKQLCFRFNVPLTTLALTPENTSTLEGTKLYGSKLMCRCCNVELNSMQQYEEHMKSKSHKLRAENKPARPDKRMKKSLAPFYKDVKKEKDEGGKDSKNDGDSKKPKEEEATSEDQGDNLKTSKVVRHRKLVPEKELGFPIVGCRPWITHSLAAFLSCSDTWWLLGAQCVRRKCKQSVHDGENVSQGKARR